MKTINLQSKKLNKTKLKKYKENYDKAYHNSKLPKNSDKEKILKSRLE